MATYPALIQVVGSKELLDDGTVVERAVSGKVRLQTFYSQTRGSFVVVHEVYTPDKETLLAFYVTNKFQSVDFVWQGDGITYPCRFGGAPQAVPIQGDGYWQITVQLVVV